MTLADIRARAEAELQALIADVRPVEQRIAAALHLGALHSQLQALEERKATMVQRVEDDFTALAAKLRDEFKALTQ